MNVVSATHFDAQGDYTWTVPNGVTQARVVVVGGGGGGGGGYTNGQYGSAGGGSGGSVDYTLSVTPGDKYHVRVGGGGSGGAGGTNNFVTGTNGQRSRFEPKGSAQSSFLYANGGEGGYEDHRFGSNPKRGGTGGEGYIHSSADASKGTTYLGGHGESGHYNNGLSRIGNGGFPRFEKDIGVRSGAIADSVTVWVHPTNGTPVAYTGGVDTDYYPGGQDGFAGGGGAGGITTGGDGGDGVVMILAGTPFRIEASISKMVKQHWLKSLEPDYHVDTFAPKNVSFNTMRDWHQKHARGGASFSATDKSETKFSDYLSIHGGSPTRWKVLPLICYMQFKAETSSRYGTNDDGAVGIAVKGNWENLRGRAEVKLRSVTQGTHGSGPVIKTMPNCVHNSWNIASNLTGSTHYDFSIYWIAEDGEEPRWEHHFRFQLGTVGDSTGTNYKSDKRTETCNQTEYNVTQQDTGVFYAGHPHKFRPAVWGDTRCHIYRPDNATAQTWSRFITMGLPPGKDDPNGLITGVQVY